MNHHLPKVQHGLPTQQPNPTQPTRLPIFPIYAQAAKTAEKSENSDGGLVQNHTNFLFQIRPRPTWKVDVLDALQGSEDPKISLVLVFFCASSQNVLC